MTLTSTYQRFITRLEMSNSSWTH